MSEHPFLAGNFAPLQEELTVLDLPVTGAIPGELRGRFLRIGPNPITPPDPARYHWFLGKPMLHDCAITRNHVIIFDLPVLFDATMAMDDWVLAYVYDAAENRSDLVVLPAQDFAGQPLATIHLPTRIPFGFHGNWVPDPY